METGYKGVDACLKMTAKSLTWYRNMAIDNFDTETQGIAEIPHEIPRDVLGNFAECQISCSSNIILGIGSQRQSYREFRDGEWAHSIEDPVDSQLGSSFLCQL